MIVFYIVGMIFSIFGLYMVLDTYLFRKRARSLKGNVTGYEKTRSKNGFYYYPVVRYSDEGMTYQFRSDIGSSVMVYAIEEKVDVLLFQNRHSSARLKRMARPLLASAFLFMGLITFGIALSGIESVEHRLFAANAGLLTMMAAVYVLLYLSNVYNKRKERSFTYELNKSGVIGYEVTDAFITDALLVKKHTLSKNTYAVSAVIGALLIAGALYWTNHLHDFIDKAIRTHGSIVGEQSSQSDGTTTYAAVIEFTPYKSEVVRFTSNISSSNPSWDVGDDVYVYYDPDNAKDAMMDSGWFNYFFQIMIGSIGLLILTVSGWQLWKNRNRKS